MYANQNNTAPSSRPSAAMLTEARPSSPPATSGTPANEWTATASRATLQTRPRIQRTLIRYWEYIPVVRGTILAIRLLAVALLTFVGAVMTAGGNAWGLTLLAAAVAIFAISLWVFKTASKGWPVVKA